MKERKGEEDIDRTEEERRHGSEEMTMEERSQGKETRGDQMK